MPEAVLVVIGSAAQGVGLIVIPLVPGVACLLIGMAILAFGQGVCVPALLALVSKAGAASEQGEIMGMTQSASSLARIVGPLFAMGLVRAMNPAASMLEGAPVGAANWSCPFYASGLLMFAAVGMAIVTRARLLARPDGGGG